MSRIRPGIVSRVPATMIGRRRPKRVFNRSDHAPTSGGTAIARKPPMPMANPIAPFWDPFDTTASTWLWISTVVRGIQRKLLPNQKALRAVWRTFPKEASVVPVTAAAVAMAARLS